MKNSNTSATMKTSIIILTYNKLEHSRDCIESIRKYTRPGTYEIIVIDNNSTDGTVDWLKQQDDIRTIFNSENKGFPAGCNQGIRMAGGDDILLLNNDVIVTHNWLDNMSACLHSADDIGAVGPVTNFANYYQTIRCKYHSLEELHEFARRFNVSNQDLWEPRIKLIGFCMLIRKSITDQIGLLDERFSPGHFEDDDYSARIRREGYRLMLCRDTFIHHFGSASFKDDPQKHVELGVRNAKIFEDKWGFNSEYSSYIRHEIIECMDADSEAKIKVLEIGCGCGATLLKIKHECKAAELYGIELNEDAAIDARAFADVRSVDVENDTLDYPENFFDYIIFADVLEHLYDPWKVLRRFRSCLSDSGVILASIPNTMHYTLIRELINGSWTYQDAGLLDRTHIRFFTKREITKMFVEAGYSSLEFKVKQSPISDVDLEFIEKLGALGAEELIPQYKAHQYIVKASKRQE